MTSEHTKQTKHTKHTKPCLVCRTQLEELGSNQPIDGTAFTTSGHYGSSVIDSFDPLYYLTIVICDNCLNKAIRENVVADSRAIRLWMR